MVFYQSKRGIPQLPVLQKSLIAEMNEWVNLHLFICPKHSHHRMTLIREFPSYRKFAAATPEQIQGPRNQAGQFHPKLVFNPTTGTYPAVSVVSVAAEDEVDILSISLWPPIHLIDGNNQYHHQPNTLIDRQLPLISKSRALSLSIASLAPMSPTPIR